MNIADTTETAICDLTYPVYIAQDGSTDQHFCKAWTVALSHLDDVGPGTYEIDDSAGKRLRVIVQDENGAASDWIRPAPRFGGEVG